MCGCFVLLLGAVAPRFALFLMAIFNNEISKAFNGSWVMPLFGWFLLPYTTLAYVLVHWYSGDVAGFSWFFVAFGFVLDIGSYASSAARRNEIQRYTNYSTS